jgi:phosphoenolpyruvate carboxylase
MEAFAGLVSEADIRDELMALLLEDREAGLRQITELFGRPVTDRRMSQLQNTIRRGKVLDNLHQLQLKYLKAWRAAKETAPEVAEPLLKKLLLLTNGIAGGLKSTG